MGWSKPESVSVTAVKQGDQVLVDQWLVVTEVEAIPVTGLVVFTFEDGVAREYELSMTVLRKTNIGITDHELSDLGAHTDALMLQRFRNVTNIEPHVLYVDPPGLPRAVPRAGFITLRANEFFALLADHTKILEGS